MPTGQAIVNGALTALGLLEQGGTPSVSDSTDLLSELNIFWDAAGIDENWVYAVLTGKFALPGGGPPYTIGAGAQINVARPRRIYSAALITQVGASQQRRQLAIVDEKVYFAHADLATSAVTSDELYFDNNLDASQFAAVYLFPVPNGAAAQYLELQTGVIFSAWTLNGNYNIPYGYQDAIQYVLAWRGLPRFGAAVAQQTAEVIRELAQKAEARIMAANAANRVKPPMQPGAQSGQGPSPITTPAIAGFQGLQPKG